MNKFPAYLIGNIISTNSAEAFTIYKKSAFGEPVEGKIQYSLTESIYLFEKNKIEIFQNNKLISKNEFLKKLQKIDKKISLKYSVFKDLRDKGYIVKTALKFGADFRVYPKGTRPGKSHAKWLVFAEHESKKHTWQDFASKNRVAHSTKKKLLLAIIDEENKISYYEVSWVKP